MFDCPLANQTSPTTTFLKVREWSAQRTTRSRPLSLSFIASSQAVQCPPLSATAVRRWLANSTSICLPAFAVPQMGTCTPRWRTA